MPPQNNEPEHTMVQNDSALRALCSQLKEAGTFGFDTEFIRERSFLPELCLLQVAVGSTVAVVDPYLVDVSPFWQLVTDPAIQKVVHSGQQDLEICYLQIGRIPANIFDVQVAAGLTGLAYPLSYGKLVRHVCHAETVQGESYSDWSRRPLSDAQLHYAIEDVVHLLELRDELERRLERLGRASYLAEEMKLLEDSDLYAPDSSSLWRRVRGWKNLNQRRLSILRELAMWRHDAARRADVPPRTLLRDEVLTALARKKPGSAGQLREVRGFPRPLAEREGGSIIKAIAAGANAPVKSLPSSDMPDNGPGPEKLLVDLAAVVGQALCMARGLDHGMLAARNDYVEMVRELRSPPPAGPTSRLMTGWRYEFAGRILAETLAGDRSMRVVGGVGDPRLDLD